jgi:hypothetical protein
MCVVVKMQEKRQDGVIADNYTTLRIHSSDCGDSASHFRTGVNSVGVENSQRWVCLVKRNFTTRKGATLYLLATWTIVMPVLITLMQESDELPSSTVMEVTEWGCMIGGYK